MPCTILNRNLKCLQSFTSVNPSAFLKNTDPLFFHSCLNFFVYAVTDVNTHSEVRLCSYETGNTRKASETSYYGTNKTETKSDQVSFYDNGTWNDA